MGARRPMAVLTPMGGPIQLGGQCLMDGLTRLDGQRLTGGRRPAGGLIQWAVPILSRTYLSPVRDQHRASCPGRRRPGTLACHRPLSRAYRNPLSRAYRHRTGRQRSRAVRNHPGPRRRGRPHLGDLRLAHLTRPGRCPGWGLRRHGRHWSRCAWPAWAPRRGPVRRCHYRAHSRPRPTSQATVLQFCTAAAAHTVISVQRCCLNNNSAI